MSKYFQSYHQGRQEMVTINNITSSLKSIQTGVPQGSVLGPLLYLLYINDLPLVLTTAEMLMYADDTALIITGKNLSDIEEQMNTELAKLADWFAANRLTINAKKKQNICYSTPVQILLHMIYNSTSIIAPWNVLILLLTLVLF